MVSCTYLVYDAWSRTLSFANAGHDAPLLIVGGEVGELEMEHKGVLLGVRGKGLPALPTYREETRYLPAGSGWCSTPTVSPTGGTAPTARAPIPRMTPG